MQSHGIEYNPVGHKLGVDILVAERLTEVEVLFCQYHIRRRHAVDGKATHTGG